MVPDDFCGADIPSMADVSSRGTVTEWGLGGDGDNGQAGAGMNWLISAVKTESKGEETEAQIW